MKTDLEMAREIAPEGAIETAPSTLTWMDHVAVNDGHVQNGQVVVRVWTPGRPCGTGTDWIFDAESGDILADYSEQKGKNFER